jgi:hypothetical protein
MVGRLCSCARAEQSGCVGLHKEGASFGAASHVALCGGHVLCAG